MRPNGLLRLAFLVAFLSVALVVETVLEWLGYE